MVIDLEHPDALVIESDAPEAEEAAPRKKRKSTSPTARCMAELKRRGWTAGIVEKFVGFPPPGHRVDLFGIIDIVAIVPPTSTGSFCFTPGAIIGIQASPGSTHAAHRDKILAEPKAREWLSVPGNRLELWSWSKRGDRGKAKRWTLRVEAFTAESWRQASTELPAELLPDAIAVHQQRRPRIGGA